MHYYIQSNIKEEIKKLKNKGAFHIIVGNFITKFVSFFGSIFLVRFLSKSEYGILSYYENFVSYLIILSGCGLVSGVLRYMVLLPTTEEKKKCFIYALRRGSYWNLLLVLLGMILMVFYPHPQTFSDFFYIGILLVLGIPFIYLINVSLSALRALFAHKQYAVISFVTSSLLIIARVIGAMLNGGVEAVTLAKIIVEIICALCCVLYLWKKYFGNVRCINIEEKIIKKMNTYSFQMMLTDGLWAIFMLNDLFLLGQFSGSETVVADYKVAYVIPANLSIITSAVGVFVAPYFTKYENEGSGKWVREKTILVLKITGSIMAIASITCFILAKPLIVFLYGKEYLSAVPVMQVLLLASFFNNGIRATIANILSAIGIQKLNLYIASGGMLMQVILDIYLIPVLGGLGVAYSSVIVYMFMSVALGIVIWKKYFGDKKMV